MGLFFKIESAMGGFRTKFSGINCKLERWRKQESTVIQDKLSNIVQYQVPDALGTSLFFYPTH